MTSAPQLPPKPFVTFGRAACVVAHTILLRAGIIGLHHLTQIDYGQFANLSFSFLPALEITSLILAISLTMLPLKLSTRFTNAGIAVLMAVIINASLRISDLIQSNQTCNTLDFYKFETFCEAIFMQSFINIPFAIFGIIVLLLFELYQD